MGGTSRRRSCPRLYDAGHVPLRNSILYPPPPPPLLVSDSNSTGSKGSSKLEYKFVGMWYRQDVLGGQHVQQILVSPHLQGLGSSSVTDLFTDIAWGKVIGKETVFVIVTKRTSCLSYHVAQISSKG
ncbi:hypothetical protein CEXT_164611 [Caerostris extrusa]|uniref:Uncharacterized protein n=1 Tax=Caerostris extrusa TaxID=172846 RepID=A0AAV4SIP7_CAEEX|nr:hypothetical protein CEXT_164611 [Caerostris extrusa]